MLRRVVALAEPGYSLIANETVICISAALLRTTQVALPFLQTSCLCCWSINACARTAGYNMQSSKVVNKIKESEQSINRKAASTLRKKLSAIDPAPPLDIEESYLEFSMKSKKEVRPKQPEVSLKRDVFMTPNNKIYNAKLEGPRAARGEELRPRSSNSDKYQKSIEIHSLAEQKPEVRPGSSKSSRLFKKKSSTLGGDDMHNVEDDSFIKVTTRERDPAATMQRQRIGTSLSKKNRGGLEKFQSKLDPEFFNLFAS